MKHEYEAGAIVRKDQEDWIESEFVSARARSKLLRLLTRRIDEKSKDAQDYPMSLIYINRAVNISQSVRDQERYILEWSEMDGGYLPPEYAWHEGKLRTMFSVYSNIHFFDTLGDLIETGMMDVHDVNEVLSKDGTRVQFAWGDTGVEVRQLDPDDLPPDGVSNDDHENVRTLVRRMENLFAEGDWPGMIHSAGSILEVLAHETIKNPRAADQPFGSFKEAFRKQSALPEALIDTVEQIYKWRNEEPLAGHGTTSKSDVTREDAFVVRTMVHAIIKIQRELQSGTADLAVSRLSKAALTTNKPKKVKVKQNSKIPPSTPKDLKRKKSKKS